MKNSHLQSGHQDQPEVKLLDETSHLRILLLFHNTPMDIQKY